MTWYEKIIAAHTAVTDAVSHYERMQSDRYFVWQEESSNDFMADGIHAGKAVTGTTDLFTKMEFDPWAEALEQSMTAMGIPWALESVQYEDDTGFIHMEWTWEATDNGDDTI